MSVIQVLATAGTIASGLVAVLTVAGIVGDWVTDGWVQKTVQGWLGIGALRQDHEDTQAFLTDMARAHNDLARTVCREHDIPDEKRPEGVDADYYQRRMDNGQPEAGDFREALNDD